ncbi:CCA tRNA nucleotidyltransferase [Ligilactobacillus sp. WILCCON 0076]|uniref:CCA-adding enzyme n=1 Tax=Ligilactobacillus ubinensis TaxID=2876789 RepID=A0A9X2JL15_9LACO|nr:CCA tRNA nucleotidyltransferase [Ligilactobacillus ubinensis]MCP0886155.1 CCA tRNA nucleotidyltransferase [Ligilactobacillus ubinensis]
MKIINLPQPFKDALPILEKLRDAGFEAYFVGGSVRDTLLNLPIHDVDIATSAYPEEIKNLFSKTVDTGIEHGTVMVLDHGTGYEITTFRTESTYQDYRRPDKVQFVRSLDEDLKRRDLTINALALKTNGEIIDLFGGLKDLDKHLLRAVGVANERFHEDALRMMRTVRFASQLDFKIDNETLTAISQNAALLSKISVERIRVEWIKLLIGKNPRAGLEDFLKTKLYMYCPLFELKEAGLEKIKTIPNLKLDNEEQCWTLIATCFELTAEEAGQLVHAWKCSKELKMNVTKAKKAVEAMLANELTPYIQYLTGRDMLEVACRVVQLINITDYTSMSVMLAYEGLPIKSRKDLVVDGNVLRQFLNIEPGPQLGKMLIQLELAVVNRKVRNEKLALLEYAQKLIVK